MVAFGFSIMGIVVLSAIIYKWRKGGIDMLIGMLIDILSGFWWLFVSAIIVGTVIGGLVLLLSLVF